MSARLFVAWFGDEGAILAATAEARRAGFAVHDVYTPYPVHGMDEAMGLRPSRLTWVCFACGLVGCLLALGFQTWTSGFDWPLNIGGKPRVAIPAYIPVAFELTVLFAGLGTVAALFLRARLLPRRAPRFQPEGVTNDRFALALAADAGFDEEKARGLCERFRASKAELREVTP